MTNSQPFLYLAPIRGLTDSIFRNTLHRHFKGYDAAIAPFINPQQKSLFEDKIIWDVLPENNPDLPIVPQLLHTNPDDFLVLAERLGDLGYKHINWNLGCPAPMVARKKRGSGLLPYPEQILDLLNQVVPRLKVELSIKTRLGYNDFSELQYLLPKLNSFPLKEVIIHARLGKQLYRGTTYPEKFLLCCPLTSHQLTYNGDINTLSTYQDLSSRLPEVTSWMLGRGALGNPFLAEEIKAISTILSQDKHKRLFAFHEDLLHRYQEKFSGPSHILSRFKQLWPYLIHSFPGQEKKLKPILKATKVQQYQDLIKQLFDYQSY